jgi:hypothetical protein
MKGWLVDVCVAAVTGIGLGLLIAAGVAVLVVLLLRGGL